MNKQLTPSNLHNYQTDAVQHIVDRDESMLWLSVGLGKTISALTAFGFLKSIGQASAMLIVAPLRVCQLTWRQEAEKWSHTTNLTFSLMCGSEKKRQRALFRKADVYLVNYESLTWLATQLTHYFIEPGRAMPFDMLVFDEVSKVKREDSKRFAAFSPLAPEFSRRVGLTASPCSNGMQDVWGQFFMLDGGKRLHNKFKTFQSAFFYQGNGAYAKWLPYPDTKEMIINRISDMTIEMSADDAGLDIPELTVIDTWVELPPKKMKLYKQLETQFFIELDEGGQIEVFNRAALCNKLLQFSNGRVYNYPDEQNPDCCVVEKVHDLKYDALAEIVEGSGDDPILLAYNFTSERDRIMELYPDAECLTGVAEAEAISIMDRFNKGEIKLLIAHPLSAGHGLNLQHACNIIVWFGLGYNLELYEQFIGRIHRQGLRDAARCFRIVTRGTMDEAVMSALRDKDVTQSAMKAAINEYRGVECKGDVEVLLDRPLKAPPPAPPPSQLRAPPPPPPN